MTGQALVGDGLVVSHLARSKTQDDIYRVVVNDIKVKPCDKALKYRTEIEGLELTAKAFSLYVGFTSGIHSLMHIQDFKVSKFC